MTALTTIPVDVDDRILDRGERCDACSARATVAAFLMDGAIVLCGHHFHRHQPQLEKVARWIIDERES